MGYTQAWRLNLRKRAVAASAAFILGPLSASVFASISVEQIEAYTDSTAPYVHYAPVNFGSSSSVTLSAGEEGGGFGGLTFHAVDTSKEGSCFSDHAYTVGQDMYGSSTVAYPYVTDIYCDAYDSFLNNVVQTQDSIGMGPAPGDFVTGVKVVNASYVLDYGTTPPTTATTDTDALRRMDYMVNKDDVTFVTSAVTSVGDGNTYYLNWSCFNSLAVAGVQSFSPIGGPGKQHADLYGGGDASFVTAQASGFAVGLDGHAQAASQTDALHSVVTRSLLMAGADKTFYSRDTANNLGTLYGAGEADFGTSLGIMLGGEKSLLNVSSGMITGSPATSQQGWTYGNASAGAQTVILFNSSNAITSLTASLNWNVNSPVTGGQINTSNASLQFPNLTLEVRPVTYNSGTGKYVLGANQSNTMLHSAATGDNVQYLYDTTSLPAGNYAFLITGDASLTPLVGFSYTLGGSFASQWNSSAGSSWGTISNWTNGVPDGKAAQAKLLSAPGLTSPGTITLDGNYTLGQLTFNNSNGYTITAGSGGTIFLDDTGDSTGTVNPFIAVAGGSHVIAVPVSMVSGANLNTAGGTTLTLSGGLSGSGSVTKTGAGILTAASSLTAASFDLQRGTTSVTSAGSFNTGGVTVESGATLNFAASATSGILVRNVGVALTLNSGAALTVSPATLGSNRQLLNATAGISIAGTTDAWTGKLDLANNDLDLPGASLAAVTNQIKQGYNAGTWNGSGGILTSSAAANTAHLTALGVIQNNQSGTALYTASNPFDTATPGTTDILVKYTYVGDANLDGKVDGTDYSRIDNGYLLHLTGWFNGDFNYDGVVNGSDYTLIDNAFNTQGAVISTQIADPSAVVTAQIAAVPEPDLLGSIGIAAGLALLRRRKTPARQIP